MERKLGFVAKQVQLKYEAAGHHHLGISSALQSERAVAELLQLQNWIYFKEIKSRSALQDAIVTQVLTMARM
ncbi:MAG: hypothetical protein REI78_03230 [Pedobacter sp.]|nr:hypothetical protein [Pedobacter sp.]MDQ8052006.1 hypothetical protein [Pedobacter sp.]